jgi:hypothetical protein
MHDTNSRSHSSTCERDVSRITDEQDVLEATLVVALHDHSL